MNKSELVEQIVAKAALNKQQAVAALNAVIDSFSDALVAGDKITLIGFGTFDLGYRAARKGINPSNKQSIDIAEKVSVKFKAGKELADAVDNAKNKAAFNKPKAAAKPKAEVKPKAEPKAAAKPKAEAKTEKKPKAPKK
jgi:DNA-binding protein HU-beta